MKTIIEELRFVETGEKRYWMFWVRFLFGHVWVSVGGWRYNPETRKLSTPSVYKGKDRDKGRDKWLNTTKMSTEVYNEVLAEITRLVDGMEEPQAA